MLSISRAIKGHGPLRPAVVLTNAYRGNWILCQVTSKPYGDNRAVEITNQDFTTGGLRVVSYARPAKLFTAHESLFMAEVGLLDAPTLKKVRETVSFKRS